MTLHDPPQTDRPMPETPAGFEDRLRRLPWREPGPALDRRIAEVLASEPASYPLPWVRRWSAAAAVLLLGVGVAWAVMVVTGDNGEAPTTPTIAQDDRPREVKASTPRAPGPRIEQVWLTSEPTGQVVIDGGRALEAVRVTAVRHVSFEDEQGVSYDVAVPVEQVMYIPASYE